MLLREVEGQRYLPIWIGAVEATAIAFAQQGVVPPRPLTHDLLKDVLEAAGNELTEVRITALQDGDVLRDAGVRRRRRGERPASDAIALALRTGSRIFVCRGGARGGRASRSPDEEEDEVEKFREFLDQVSPEDFETR